ncbi:hypothetical protein BH09CHL1_BH09CHL1_00870 [soil metagenome]
MVRNRKLFIAALLGMWLLLLVPNAEAGQESATAPVSIDVDAPSPTVTTPPVVPPTVAVPLSTATQSVTPVPTPSSTPTPAATATAAPTTTPTPAAQLSTAISPAIDCVLSSAANEVVQGGSIDYRCSIAVDLSGTDLNGETARLDWSLSATTGAGWSAQLRLPDQSWSSTGSTASLDDERELDLDAIAPLALMAEVRIHREACVTGAAMVSLSSSVTVQLLGANGAASGSPVQGTSTGEIAPELAAIPEPQLSFAGSLDFGQVSPAAWGDAVSASGEITLIVSGLSSSCGTWNVVLSGSVLQASNGSTIPVGNLALIAVDNAPVSTGSCPLAGGCLVMQLVAGPRAVDTESFLLSLSLTVPPETLSASFSSSITASIVAD